MAQKRPFNEDNEGLIGWPKIRPFRNFTFSERQFRHIFGPVVRKVVQDAVNRALLLEPQPQPQPGPRHAAQPGLTSGVRSLHLHFVNCLPSTIYTNNSIKAEDGNPIRIELIDTRSRTRVESGPLSSIKLDIDVLDGDFRFDDEEDWTERDYNGRILREREGKRPLVVGNLKVTLAEGVGDVGDIHFTDNSCWVKSGKFILGAKVDKKHSGEGRIREGRSQSFRVKDHRGELHKKHKTPSKSDEIWRLRMIGKDGAYHKRLSRSGIETVDDLLWRYAVDPSSVRRIFARHSDGSWEKIIQHAMACVEHDYNLYTYHGAGQISLRFNSIYQVVEAAFDGHNYLPAHTLSSDQKNAIEVVKRQAYKNNNDWVLVNDLTALGFSRPSDSLQDGPFSIREEGLQQVDPQFTREDQQETWQGFNPAHSLYSASHIHEANTSYQLEASAAQTSYPMTSNSSMENVFFGSYNGEEPVSPSCGTAVHDIPQFLIQPYSTPWGQETDFLGASSNQEYEDFPLAYYAGKPKVAWGMIRAAVMWRTVLRRVAAKKIARSIFNY